MSAGASVEGRMPCCVPFCGRTVPAGKFSEWVCGNHWRAVGREAKARHREAKRLVRKVGTRWVHEEGSDEWRRVVAVWDEAGEAWKVAREEAIEAAMGIG